MRADIVNVASAELTNPNSAQWSDMGENVTLAPVPLQAQPTQYIRTAWSDRQYGRTAEVQVAALRNEERLFLRLEWSDDPVPNSEFNDAAGVLFPTDGAGAPATLGDFEAPLSLWYWEDGRQQPLTYKARGAGLFAREDAYNIEASALLNEDRWSLVLSGPLGIAEDGKIAVVIWNGSNEERAGLAAVTPEWVALELK